MMGCRICYLQITLSMLFGFHVSGIKTLKSNVLCKLWVFALYVWNVFTI